MCMCACMRACMCAHTGGCPGPLAMLWWMATRCFLFHLCVCICVCTLWAVQASPGLAMSFLFHMCVRVCMCMCVCAHACCGLSGLHQGWPCSGGWRPGPSSSVCVHMCVCVHLDLTRVGHAPVDGGQVFPLLCVCMFVHVCVCICVCVHTLQAVRASLGLAMLQWMPARSFLFCVCVCTHVCICVHARCRLSGPHRDWPCSSGWWPGPSSSVYVCMFVCTGV